jgi:hypothetical protein
MKGRNEEKKRVRNKETANEIKRERKKADDRADRFFSVPIRALIWIMSTQ